MKVGAALALAGPGIYLSSQQKCFYIWQAPYYDRYRKVDRTRPSLQGRREPHW